MIPKVATIKEIAALAGVSRGTVDRALNNRGIVNPETAERIIKIANSFNYKPNKAGIALAVKKKKLRLGVVLLGEQSAFFKDVLKGVDSKTTELEDFGCTVFKRNPALNEESQLEAINELLEKEINGLVIAPYNHPKVASKLKEITESGIPVVTTNTDIPNSGRIAYVGSDYFLSGETAGGLMTIVTGGNANVGIVTGSLNVLCHSERIAGFKHNIEETNQGIKIAAISENFDDDFESYAVTNEMLQKHPEINAIYCTAAGVYGTCKAVTSIKPHKKIHIICHDAVQSTINLLKEGIITATICQQPEIQGSKPLDILFNHLMTGLPPKKEFYYTQLDIKIKENI